MTRLRQCEVNRLVRGCLFAVCVFGMSFSTYADGQGEEVSYGPAGPPTVDYFEGRVTVNGIEAEFGQQVPPGSVVQVGEASFCEIVFANRSRIVQVHENTIAIVKMDSGRNEIDLRFGAVSAVFDKLQTIGEGGSFKLQTPTAVAGVRGTVFFINVEDLSNTYVCVCNGTVGFKNPEGDESYEVSANHHEAYRATKASNGRITATSAALLYHTDDSMESLAGKIGKKIDWSRLE